MGTVIDFKSRRRLDSAPASTPEEEILIDQPEVDRLTTYLESLNLDEAKKAPKDLESASFVEAECVCPEQIEKIVYDALIKQSELSGDLSEEKKKALNAFVQLFDDYATKVHLAELVLAEDFDPAVMSGRTEEVRLRIKNKKLELLSAELGVEVVSQVKDLREYVDRGMLSDDWRKEMEIAHRGIRPVTRSGQEFMDAAAFVNSVKFDDNNIASLADQRTKRDIKEVAGAFDDPSKGDPSRVNKSDNSYWNLAGQIERQYTAELRRLQTAKDVEYIENKVAIKLAQDKIRGLTSKINLQAS